MNDGPHNIVVTKCKQPLSVSVPRVPAAQAGRALVWEQHIVLCVVEDSIGGELLLASGASASVCDQTARRGQFPQLH